jgi:serine/threonine protein kinase
VFLDHWFEDSSSQYIFLEYCANKVAERLMKTLDERCKKYDSLDEKAIKRYGLQIIDALKYLHSKRVLHRE